MSRMDTVVVHRCHDDIDAAQIRDMLMQEDIPCQVASNVPHTVLPLTTDGLGEVRIMVRPDHASRAVELIALFLAEGQPLEGDHAFGRDIPPPLHPAMEPTNDSHERAADT